MDENGNEGPRLSDESQDNFASLMEQVRLGSPEAAAQLWRKYGPYVIYAVRRSLNQRLRSRFDSQDFAQSAWASFFTDLPDASRLESPAALVKLLTRMARNKVVSEDRRELAAKRKMNRQRGVRVANLERVHDPRTPTPSQEATAIEIVEQVAADQPPKFGRVMQARLEGMDTAEIADLESMSERSVRRVLSRLRRLVAKRWRIAGE